MTDAALLIHRTIKREKTWEEHMRDRCPHCALANTGGILCFQCILGTLKQKWELGSLPNSGKGAEPS